MTYRKNFPIFSSKLAYLDSAASTQKPSCVIQAMNDFATTSYANIHRGAYQLSANSTKLYEESRENIAEFINVPSAKSLIFTRNATEGVNLLAYTLEDRFAKGDSILVSELEHHCNIVPWQRLAEKKGLNLSFACIDAEARLDLDDCLEKIDQLKPKLIALTMHSNAFGTIPQIEQVISAAKRVGALVLLDAAQYIVHHPLDVAKLGVDFLVFSGHKLYGPTGIGCLYGREEILQELPPFMSGGDMITSVSKDGSTYSDIPNKFEAGTPAIVQAIGLSAAVDYVKSIGYESIQEIDHRLTKQALEILSSYPEVQVYGPSGLNERSAIISFNIVGIHPHDFATIADSEGVQIRAGFHCAMPALQALGLSATARISFGVYSEESDLIQLKLAVEKALQVFSPKL